MKHRWLKNIFQCKILSESEFPHPAPVRSTKHPSELLNTKTPLVFIKCSPLQQLLIKSLKELQSQPCVLLLPVPQAPAFFLSRCAIGADEIQATVLQERGTGWRKRNLRRAPAPLGPPWKLMLLWEEIWERFGFAGLGHSKIVWLRTSLHPDMKHPPSPKNRTYCGFHNRGSCSF